MTEKTFNELLQKMEEVWGEYSDLQDGGFPYVAFIIKQDIQDMADDDWDEEESIEELSDIAINAIRMMDELGYDPSKEIFERLENHQQKNPEKLITTYKKKYNQHGED